MKLYSIFTVKINIEEIINTRNLNWFLYLKKILQLFIVHKTQLLYLIQKKLYLNLNKLTK